jgi:hypothetical protein
MVRRVIIMDLVAFQDAAAPRAREAKSEPRIAPMHAARLT